MNNRQKAKIEKILSEQQKLLEETKKEVHKIYNFLLWGWLISFLKLLIFVILPIVLGIIYLPPFIEKFSTNFNSIMRYINRSPNINTIDINSILKNLK